MLPLALLAGIYLWQVTHYWFATSDTHAVLLGTAAARDCLDAGKLVNCTAAGYDVSHYPLLQYIPVYLLTSLGFTLQGAYQGLCWLNAAAYAGMLGIMWQVGRRSRARAIAPLLLLSGLAAPLLWYSHAGFREALAGMLRVLLVASVLLDWPVVLTGLAAGLGVVSNDPALPFVVGLGALALLVRRRRDGTVRRGQAIALGIGVAAGAAMFAAFNVFRYGSLLNTWFSEAHVQVPDVGVRVSSLAALLVAPNVGLVWFWPLAVFVLGAVAVLTWRSRRSDPQSAALGAGVLAVLAGWLGFLIAFYSPFGWEAWGPRYLVGWVPALVTLGAYIFAEPLAAMVTSILEPARRLALASAVVVLLGLPQFGAFLDWRAGFRLFNPDDACPVHLPDPRDYSRMFGDMHPYYSCKLHQAWRHKAALLDGYAVLGHPWAALEATVYGAALVALLVRVRRVQPRAG